MLQPVSHGDKGSVEAGIAHFQRLKEIAADELQKPSVVRAGLLLGYQGFFCDVIWIALPMKVVHGIPARQQNYRTTATCHPTPGVKHSWPNN